MSLDWKKWTKNDLIFGIVLPIIAVFVIVLISKLQSLIGGFGIVFGLTMEILELVVIVGVPLALGLLWNRWAGGASGFLMGTFYALYWSSSFHGIAGSGTVLLAYIVSPMLIGYMAGAARIEGLQNNLTGDVKKLTNFTPEYRLRVGDYRALFEIERPNVVVYRVLHRREVYR